MTGTEQPISLHSLAGSGPRGETADLDRIASDLAAEIGVTVELEMIERIVASAHGDLVGEVPEEALAEFTHRLAKTRLEPVERIGLTERSAKTGNRATTHA